jgi:hypothetical protein
MGLAEQILESYSKQKVSINENINPKNLVASIGRKLGLTVKTNDNVFNGETSASKIGTDKIFYITSLRTDILFSIVDRDSDSFEVENILNISKIEPHFLGEDILTPYIKAIFDKMVSSKELLW